jgi:hypothetical protein
MCVCVCVCVCNQISDLHNLKPISSKQRRTSAERAKRKSKLPLLFELPVWLYAHAQEQRTQEPSKLARTWT